MNQSSCVVCAQPVPEGRQVCRVCEGKNELRRENDVMAMMKLCKKVDELEREAGLTIEEMMLRIAAGIPIKEKEGNNAETDTL